MMVMAVFFVLPSADACIISHMSREMALEQTDSTVLAEIIAISPVVEKQLGSSTRYRVRILHAERGAMTAGSVVDVELFLHHARWIKGSIRCPLQRGAGTEHALQVGESYRMLIKHDAEGYELYWTEFSQNADPGAAA